MTILLGPALLLALLLGVTPPPATPMESMILVRSQVAPLLNEIEDDEPPAEIAHAGELLELGRDIPAMKKPWKAPMGDGTTGEREGPMAEVRWAPGGAILYAFKAFPQSASA